MESFTLDYTSLNQHHVISSKITQERIPSQHESETRQSVFSPNNLDDFKKKIFVIALLYFDVEHGIWDQHVTFSHWISTNDLLGIWQNHVNHHVLCHTLMIEISQALPNFWTPYPSLILHLRTVMTVDDKSISCVCVLYRTRRLLLVTHSAPSVVVSVAYWILFVHSSDGSLDNPSPLPVTEHPSFWFASELHVLLTVNICSICLSLVIYVMFLSWWILPRCR